MAYLPKNRYKVLYTNGNELVYKDTNKPYIGYYIELFNGKLFAGSDIENLKGKLTRLRPKKYKNISYNSVNNRVYSIIEAERTSKQGRYQQIPSASPLPTIVDYSKGFFIRYFATRLNTKTYIEISQDVFENFNKYYNTNLYKVFFLRWSLKANSEEENQKTLLKYITTLPNLNKFLTNLGQYKMVNGLIDLGPNNRIYVDGGLISQNLPKAYQRGNPDVNTINNTNVPSNQHCGNCAFLKNNMCTRWEAEVRPNFWCAAYVNNSIEDINQTPEIPDTPIVSEKTVRDNINVATDTPINRGGRSGSPSNNRGGSY